jgi:hypothetical protein
MTYGYGNWNFYFTALQISSHDSESSFSSVFSESTVNSGDGSSTAGSSRRALIQRLLTNDPDDEWLQADVQRCYGVSYDQDFDRVVSYLQEIAQSGLCQVFDIKKSQTKADYVDMSGSMRYGGLHVSVKRMALALQGLVLREYPGDYVQFIEMASFAKPRSPGEIVSLMPKPVTVFDSVVRLRADMADPAISESDVPPHFTNIQHALSLSRQHLARQDTPNKQVILITDGLPTAHFEGSQLYLLYPPHRRTEEATMREAELCRREGIVVNVFLLSGWSQSRADIQFAYRLAEAAHGRVFFTAGKELERFVVWDYRARRRSVIG